MGPPRDRNGASVDSEEEEDGYISSEDEDFDPSAANADENVSSSSGSDGEDELAATPAIKGRPGRNVHSKNAVKQVPRKKRPRKDEEEEAEDAGFDSGDQKIIQNGPTKKRKGPGKLSSSDGESGGEGGFVKTRSMRAFAKEDAAKKPLASTHGATVDIDALWRDMNSTSIRPISSRTTSSTQESPSKGNAVSGSKTPNGSELVSFWESYKFAGETKTRYVTVPRSSAQAKLHLARSRPDGVVAPPAPPDAAASPRAGNENEENEEDAQLTAEEAPKPRRKIGPEGQILCRPMRRYSPWDPNPEGNVRGRPSAASPGGGTAPVSSSRLREVDKSHLDWKRDGDENANANGNENEKRNANADANPKGSGRKALPRGHIGKEKPPPKLNVVNKSALDWAQHIDREGTREELDAARKAKGAYLDRRDFLDRVQDKKEEERRIARTTR